MPGARRCAATWVHLIRVGTYDRYEIQRWKTTKDLLKLGVSAGPLQKSPRSRIFCLSFFDTAGQTAALGMKVSLFTVWLGLWAATASAAPSGFLVEEERALVSNASGPLLFERSIHKREIFDYCENDLFRPVFDESFRDAVQIVCIPADYTHWLNLTSIVIDAKHGQVP